jgi:hypothetical protein
MQWHWGNIGSFLAGLSTVAIAVGALIRAPAVVRSWLDRQAADTDEARARAEALRAEAEERGLNRRRTLLGWSPGGVETYTVALVTDAAEMERAVPELTGGGPTGCVLLRVAPAAGQRRGSPGSRKNSLFMVRDHRRTPAAADRGGGGVLRFST